MAAEKTAEAKTPAAATAVTRSMVEAVLTAMGHQIVDRTNQRWHLDASADGGVMLTILPNGAKWSDDLSDSMMTFPEDAVREMSGILPNITIVQTPIEDDLGNRDPVKARFYLLSTHSRSPDAVDSDDDDEEEDGTA
jgi:hypothetical protein